jgi:hypothetical protein
MSLSKIRWFGLGALVSALISNASPKPSGSWKMIPAAETQVLTSKENNRTFVPWATEQSSVTVGFPAKDNITRAYQWVNASGKSSDEFRTVVFHNFSGNARSDLFTELPLPRPKPYPEFTKFEAGRLSIEFDSCFRNQIGASSVDQWRGKQWGPFRFLTSCVRCPEKKSQS